MKILVACEESQAVAVALRQRGHEAYSCDLIPCSGGHPEWHIQQDVLPLLDGYAFFYTCDGAPHYILGRWDMIIAFPPCTYLTNASAVRMRVKGEIVPERYAKAMEAKPYKIFPLASYKLTEAACLELCYAAGYFWEEDGGAGVVRLYDILDRVSCWCCCNKNLKELRNIRKYLPLYWEKLKDLQRQLERPMKGFYKGQPRGVFELGERFMKEEAEHEKAQEIPAPGQALDV